MHQVSSCFPIVYLLPDMYVKNSSIAIIYFGIGSMVVICYQTD